MKRFKILQQLSVALATFGLLVPNTSATARANEVRNTQARTVSASAKITDVALVEGGTFRGQVLSETGVAQPNVAVNVLHGKDVVASATTDRNGEFTVNGVKGGVYVVATNDAANVVRAWAPHTAPPSAVHGVLLVPDQQAVRGQMGNWISTYGCASVLIAAAVVGIVAVVVEHNDDDAS